MFFIFLFLYKTKEATNIYQVRLKCLTFKHFLRKKSFLGENSIWLTRKTRRFTKSKHTELLLVSHLCGPKRGKNIQLFSFATTTTQQCNRASGTSVNSKNVNVLVSKCSSHNENTWRGSVVACPTIWLYCIVYTKLTYISCGYGDVVGDCLRLDDEVDGVRDVNVVHQLT